MFDILAVTLLIILALVLAVLEIFFLPGITIAGICSVLFYGGGMGRQFPGRGICFWSGDKYHQCWWL